MDQGTAVAGDGTSSLAACPSRPNQRAENSTALESRWREDQCGKEGGGPAWGERPDVWGGSGRVDEKPICRNLGKTN